MPPPVNVLALFAHPDDAEFLSAGTLAHLANRGAKIHIATMTAGDCGSTILPPAHPMRQTAGRAGEFAGFHWAEGCRQHLGQGFPQDKLLGDLVQSVAS